MAEDNSTLAGYMRLAAAIVQSGRAANDQRFLQSNWCKFLTDTVNMYAQERIGRKGAVHVDGANVHENN